jgi:outer membrane biosynthesis protein TonB
MDKSFKGKITVEFNVLSDGSVISCKEIESNIKDTIFIKSILSKILKWKFPKLQIQNDTTKVVYPFLFSL